MKVSVRYRMIANSFALVVALVSFALCASAQDMSSHNHMTASSINNSELTQDWAKQRLAK